MTLTIGGGPLAADPPASNYRIDGPAGRLLWHPFGRRVRAVSNGQLIVDSLNAKLLHETGLLPQLYFPRVDVRTELLVPSRRRVHCPYKGDASYESVRVGDCVAEHAVWSYHQPCIGASWLIGHVGIDWGSMHAWFDEDEEVFGEIRDPYHRVDIRRTGRHVRITSQQTVIAESRSTLLVAETGLPNRFYLPASHVRQEYLTPSEEHTICPYKGTASYRDLQTEETLIPAAAWLYPTPLPEATALAGHLCFLADGVHTWLDGDQLN